ncbi:MAG: MFS transporter [Candidatus Sphingomonas phytovorans]|nr:MFS transporter [Sphingomonas sp.]WEK00883.1 MAG: MFS transporter [Sphingomonas sp.]
MTIDSMNVRDIAHAGPKTSRYAWSVLGVLSVVYLLNFLDRQLLSILAKPIQDELHLSDGQLGRVGGLYFALFYATISIPVAWLADRGNRVRILTVACLLWSAATMACGLSRTYAELVLARMSVGVGEAGGAPPSYSIIADYFPSERRGTALGLFSLATPLGQSLGVALGAGIAGAYGWRMSFLIVGGAGLFAAAATAWWVREPRKGATDRLVEPMIAEDRTGFIATVRMFFTRPVLYLSALAAGACSFCGYAILSFATLFLMRERGMSLGEVAIWYALVVGIATAGGIYVSGWLIDRFAVRSRQAYAIVPGVAILACIPFFIGFVYSSSWQWALAFLAAPLFLSVFYLTPAATLVQNSVAAGQRTMTSALLLLVLNVMGLGLGPTYLGAMSDYFRATDPTHSLQLAYQTLIPFFALAALLQYLLSRALAREARIV